MDSTDTLETREIIITVPAGDMYGDLTLARDAKGLVLFAHGSGSSRFSSRNRQVAKALNRAGFTTLLFDLLTVAEDQVDRSTREFRFNIDLLASRLISATEWVAAQPDMGSLSLGYFGASTGAAAALIAAAARPEMVDAVVSRGGRADMGGPALPQVTAPTLLIVGALDDIVIKLNQEAYDMLRCTRHMEIIAGASHLFEEPGTLEQVEALAIDWFDTHLRR
ncbi:dienelactone hydrolase family protein [Halopseudomonas sp.]|uniref:dienelactone hydrolase family protein n=1 Tax=Halopseudomonas sp. TaxID=2901191 RepID=UPI003565F65C